MGNPNDLYADSILLAASLLIEVDTDPHAAANSLDTVYA
jgi:hypothetical protein